MLTGQQARRPATRLRSGRTHLQVRAVLTPRADTVGIALLLSLGGGVRAKIAILCHVYRHGTRVLHNVQDS
jgi:hypothetical protein